MKYIVLCFPLIFLAAAKELVNNFQKWRTHCLFTEEVQFRSRSRLQCAAMCGETGYFDVFRYRKGKCLCVDSNGGFSHQTTLDVRNVYVRRNPQPTKNFTALCRHDPLKNASSTGPHRTSCKIDASIILPSRKLVLFSNSLVLMYGSYHDLEIGPYSSRRIPDLFPGIVGPVDAAFDDNTYVYIVQGLFVYTYPISTVLNETSAACLQNETISSMFNLRFHHRFINSMDCVTKNGDILYVFADDYLYIHDIGTNPTAVEWKSNSANNPFKSTNHTPYPHEVDACAKADSQKMLFFSGENNLIFEFSNNLGFWSQRNQTMC